MKGSFKAPLFSKEKLILLASLFSLVAWHVPATGMAHASTGMQPKDLIFEIRPLTEVEALKQKRTDLAQINKQVALVRSYLESKKAPLANYTEILLAQPNWKKIIAISNAESNMGKRCYYNNCSGITYSSGLAKYPTVGDWIVDMNSLMERRYKHMEFSKMNGIYVVPKNPNWLKATTQIYDDLLEIEEQFTKEA